MYVAKRGFAKLTDAAKAAQAVARQDTGSLPTRAAYQPRQHELRVTRLPNDLMIVSQDSDLPVTRISVAVKAGSRHESPETPGLSHALRNAVSLSTRVCTGFGLSRNLEQLGATLSATTTRDHVVYNLTTPREHLVEALKFMSYAVTKQEFKRWEVSDAGARIDHDLAIYDTQPQARLIENLHKAAFHDGLGNSLYAPKWAAHHYDAKMLRDYVASAYRSNRMAIAGVGIGHDELANHAANYFQIDSKYLETKTKDYAECDDIEASNLIKKLPEHHVNAVVQDGPSRYAGGECYEQTIDRLAYVAVAVEGAGLKNPKDVLSLALLQQVLGVEPHIKWSRGLNVSPLIKAASGGAREEFAVSALNICHSDSGLFGFAAVANAKDIARIVQASLQVFRKGQGVDFKRLQDAKNRLVACLLMRSESNCEQVNDWSAQALINGQIMTPGEAIALVEGINANDLMAFAKKVTSGKPTIAAVGNLSHLPRFDQLLA